MHFQIATDCDDPHRLNRFWSELLGYERDEDPDFIREMLARGLAEPADTIEVDGVLVWRTGAACHDPEGNGPRLLFQHVPEAKTAKNRVHVDLRPAPEASGELVERALALGATKLWDGEQGPHRWVTLADPEGNEFCISV